MSLQLAYLFFLLVFVSQNAFCTDCVFTVFVSFQEEGANDRKIGKLCDYAAKNPLRIPKVWGPLTVAYRMYDIIFQ